MPPYMLNTPILNMAMYDLIKTHHSINYGGTERKNKQAQLTIRMSVEAGEQILWAILADKAIDDLISPISVNDEEISH